MKKPFPTKWQKCTRYEQHGWHYITGDFGENKQALYHQICAIISTTSLEQNAQRCKPIYPNKISDRPLATKLNYEKNSVVYK